jgi:hypothetical protein
VLEDVGRPKWCGSTQDGRVNEEWFGNVKVGCGRSPSDPDAPGGYYPSMAELQVNHINKNLLDVDPVNLEYLCSSCHKKKDSQTATGVSIRGENELGFNFLAGVKVVKDGE